MSHRRPNFKSPSAWFISVDELYAKRLDYLISFARRHLYQTDSAVDTVHDAIAKSIEYFNRPENKTKKVYQRNIEYAILRLCKKHNKYSSVEKTNGLMGINGDTLNDD